MPLKPKMREVGQAVKFIEDCESQGQAITVGTKTVITMAEVKEDGKVYYKVMLPDRVSNPAPHWIWSGLLESA